MRAARPATSATSSPVSKAENAGGGGDDGSHGEPEAAFERGTQGRRVLRSVDSVRTLTELFPARFKPTLFPIPNLGQATGIAGDDSRGVQPVSGGEQGAAAVTIDIVLDPPINEIADVA